MTETAMEIKRRERIVQQEQQEQALEERIPRPVGYRLLILLPDVDEAYESGIAKAESTKHEERVLATIGAVIDMGKQAYKDKDRFPTGPWCKVGDHVMFRANTGTRFRVDGREFRLMNDDSIEAVVDNPSAITRA